jgi:hypothetical protein
VNPAPLVASFGEHLCEGLPKAERAVADGEDGGAHPAPCGVSEQVGPGLGGLAVAVGHRDQLLGAVRAHSHDDQDAGLGLRQADTQVDAVGPDVDVVGSGQVALAEGFVVGLPLLGEPSDRGG